MSSINNNSLTTGSSIKVLPSSLAMSTQYLSKLNQIYSEIKELYTELIALELKANRAAAENAAEEARKEAKAEAMQMILQASGTALGGAISVGSSLYMMKDTKKMKDVTQEMENAGLWEKKIGKNEQSGVLQANRRNDAPLSPEETARINTINRYLDDDQQVQTRHFGDLKTAEARLKVKMKDHYAHLTGEDGYELFGGRKPGDLGPQGQIAPQRGDDHGLNQVEGNNNLYYEEVIYSADEKQKTAIKKNINKYIKKKSEELSTLRNGAERQMLTQVWSGIGQLMTGIMQSLAGIPAVEKAQYTHDKIIYQNDMELTKTTLNQLIQNFNEAVQSQLGIFTQTIMALAQAGISPA